MATASDADSTNFSLNFRREHPPEVKLEGGAHYPQDDSCLRLTDTKDSDGSVVPLDNNAGRVIYIAKTVPFSKQTTFQTTITFTLKPINATPADGLVFFMAPENYPFSEESYGGNLGVFNASGSASHVFAVEFDAFLNPEWDPDHPKYDTALHLGIDIGSRKSKEHGWIPDSSSYLGKEVTLTVTYTRGVISAKVSNVSHPDGFEVTYQYDLSTVLPNKVEVGLAAATGSNVALHDVTAWEFVSPFN